MKFHCQPIDRRDSKQKHAWVNFWKNSDGATIFHHPDFLSYHHERFAEHHVGIYKGDTLFGLLPMARIENEARSPYGGSYGGLLLLKTPTYHEARPIAEALLAYLRSEEFNSFTFTPPLRQAYAHPCDTLLFTFMEQGASSVNSDITSVVDLDCDSILQERLDSATRNKYHKAAKQSFTVQEDAPIERFWPLMELTFAKHGTRPTHSREEWQDLMARLPEHFRCDLLLHEGVPIAGVGYIAVNTQIKMSFYHVQDDALRSLQPLTYLLVFALEKAQKEGFAYYDFGTSSVNMQARPNIFEFKEGLGGRGVFRHTYRITL